jgi:hypothetical protein
MVSVGVGVQPITDLFQASRCWSRFPAMPDSEFVGEAASAGQWVRCQVVTVHGRFTRIAKQSHC